MKSPQYELAGSESVFNLAPEVADDPWRVDREKWEAAERAAEARDYVARMQRALNLCPGIVGSDAPTSDTGRGVVVVEPGRIIEALKWLRRRFHASETIDISTELQGIAVEIAPRVRRSSNCGPRIKVMFEKPVQFELSL